MNEFKRCHPMVNFIYFLLAVTFSCILMHPAALIISFSVSFVYSIILKGKKQIKKLFGIIVPAFVLTSLINPAFNHEGVTIIAYFPNGNPLTLESILYGLAAAAMLVSTFLLFSCLNEVFTEDKIICLFGSVSPALSLVTSMTLRFVPEFIYRLKRCFEYRKSIGGFSDTGSVLKKIKNISSVFSITLTYCLENAADTAVSMKSRGYGLGRRSSFSVCTFTKKDKIILLSLISFGVYVIVGLFLGTLKIKFFPFIKVSNGTLYEKTVIASYFCFLSLPVALEISEAVKWKYTISKI